MLGRPASPLPDKASVAINESTWLQLWTAFAERTRPHYLSLSEQVREFLATIQASPPAGIVATGTDWIAARLRVTK